MANRTEQGNERKGELLHEEVHKKDEIYNMLDKLDSRKLGIVHRFVKRMSE